MRLSVSRCGAASVLWAGIVYKQCYAEAVGEMNVILVQSSTLLSLEVLGALSPVMVAYIPLVHGTTLTAALPCRCTCGAGPGLAHPTEQVEGRTHPERPCWGEQTFLIVSFIIERTVNCVSLT